MRLKLLDALAGRLPDGLRFGMSSADVEAVLGHTATRSVRKGVVGILKYGDVEFHFGPVGLWMIFLEYFDVPGGAVDLVVDAGWLRGAMSLEEVERGLLASGLIAARHTRVADEVVELRIAGAHRLSFEVGTETPGLCAIAIHSDDPRLR